MGPAPAPYRSFTQRHRQLLPRAITVYYGITLGLLAVATWNNFATTQDKVDHEAQVVASLDCDVNSFPDPLRTTLDGDLRAYTREVIDVSWPEQREGIVPCGSGIWLERFQADLLLFEPRTEREKTVTQESYRVSTRWLRHGAAGSKL